MEIIKPSAAILASLAVIFVIERMITKRTRETNNERAAGSYSRPVAAVDCCFGFILLVVFLAVFVALVLAGDLAGWL